MHNNLQNSLQTYFLLHVQKATVGDFDQAQNMCTVDQRKFMQQILLRLDALPNSQHTVPSNRVRGTPEHLLTHWTYPQFVRWFYFELASFFTSCHIDYSTDTTLGHAATWFGEWLIAAALRDFQRAVGDHVFERQTPLPTTTGHNRNTALPNTCWWLAMQFETVAKRSSHTEYFVEHSTAELGFFVFNHVQHLLGKLASNTEPLPDRWPLES